MQYVYVHIVKDKTDFLQYVHISQRSGLTNDALSIYGHRFLSPGGREKRVDYQYKKCSSIDRAFVTDSLLSMRKPVCCALLFQKENYP